MPTLNDLRTRVNDWLVARWPILVARQETYFAHNGVYWQGLITHRQIPPHVTAAYEDRIPDRLALYPTDQPASWRDLFPNWEGTSAPAALVVDVYKSSLGHGWQATVYVYYNGTLYDRCQAVGPDAAERTYGWRVTPLGGAI